TDTRVGDANKTGTDIVDGVENVAFYGEKDADGNNIWDEVAIDSLVADLSASAPTLAIDISDVTYTEGEPTSENDTTEHSIKMGSSHTYTLDNNSTSVELSFKNLNGSRYESVKVEFLDNNGDVVGTSTMKGNNGAASETHSFAPDSGVEFSSVRVSSGSMASSFEVTNLVTSGTTEDSYSYEVKLDAGLRDTDGSESLSSITIDNIPTGATIDGLTANADGSYTVAVDANGDATVTLASPTEISNTDLNSIQSSITSTESDGGETHTTMAHTSLDESADSENDSVEIDSSNLATDTGSGNDTISVDAQDLAEGEDSSSSGIMGMSIFGGGSDGGALDLDGGEGLDTLLVSADVNIDMSALDDNISNIEALTLDTGSQNVTNLSLEDVISVTDEDNILRIDGDATDSVTLNSEGSDAEWTLGDFKTDAETGATYQEVTGVEDDVTVTLEISTDIVIDQN
ncbi:MAG: hypothetical protein U9O86_01825, partial [Campylobacterota bacterium]|nr:hypothetical protein [Campylobacterota bacterium]